MILNPFKASFFAGNRQKLLADLPKNAVVVLAAHRTMQRSSDTHFAFTQEPNFYYLTGITEPDWRLILDGEKKTAQLVAPPHSQLLSTFDGVLSPEEAKEKSGVDRVLTQRQYQRWLKKVAVSGQPMYTLLPQTRLGRYVRMALNPALRLQVRQLREYGATPRDCRLHLAKIRAVKQPPEIAAMQSAIDITQHSLEALVEALPTFTYEYEIEAFITHEFRRRGSQGHAYDPIVAAGKNACTMHYIKNDAKLKKSDWLLLDVGAQVHGYAADITRTIPLGKITARQQVIVASVQRVHDGALKLLQPGANPREYVQKVDSLMMKELKKLGLLSRKSVTQMRRYFPHAIGHGLGIDVHDSLGRFDAFQPGMVLTVEPGIYIEEEGFGVRLENDILITKDGPKNLSEKLADTLLPATEKKMVY